MLKLLRLLHGEESGQDLIEYGLLALIVALGCVAGMGTLATTLNKLFGQIAADLT